MVTITDAGGSTSAAFTDVLEPSAINIDTIGFENESYLGNDGQIGLIVSGGTPGYSYMWSNGETTQNIDSLVGDSSYTVTVTDDAGCTNTMSWSLTSAVGIANIEPVGEVNVWPVPATDVVTIERTEQGAVPMQLFNVLGEAVLTSQLNTTRMQLDVSELEEGIYFLKLGEGSEAQTKRLVVAGR